MTTETVTEDVEVAEAAADAAEETADEEVSLEAILEDLKRREGRHGLTRARRQALSMLLVGLTGGIGSGKSTVAAMLADRGAVVIDADGLAREAVARGTAGFDAVVALFGPQVVDADGDLDRAASPASCSPTPRAARAGGDRASGGRAADRPTSWSGTATRRRGGAGHPAAVRRGPERIATWWSWCATDTQVRRAACGARDGRRRRCPRADGGPDAARGTGGAADVVLDNDGDRTALSAQVDALWRDAIIRAMRFRAVFFDAGETLVHPAPSFPELFAAIVTREGHPREPVEVRERPRRGPDALRRGRAPPTRCGPPARSARAVLGEVYDTDARGAGPALRRRTSPTRSTASSPTWATTPLFDDVRAGARPPASTTASASASSRTSRRGSMTSCCALELRAALRGPRDLGASRAWRSPIRGSSAWRSSAAGLAPADAAYVGDNPDFDVTPSASIGMYPVLIDRRARHESFDGPGTRIGSMSELSDVPGGGVDARPNVASPRRRPTPSSPTSASACPDCATPARR